MAKTASKRASSKRSVKSSSSTRRAASSGGRSKAASSRSKGTRAAAGKKGAKSVRKASSGKNSKVSKKVAKKAPAAKKSKVSKKVAKKAPAAKKSKVAKKAPATKKVAKKAPVAKKVVKKTKVAKQSKVAKKSTVAKKTTTRRGSSRKEATPANPRSVIGAAISRSEGDGDSSGYVIIKGRRVRMISTKGLTIKKRPRAVAVVEDNGEAEADRIRAIKTKLKAAELKKYRELLLERRRELVGVLNVMEEEALRSRGGNLSNMPLHMADVGSDTYDQDFTLGMAEAERKLLVEIDHALGRIADRTYGVCQMTGKPIPKLRLNAKPWAKYTIEAARLIESGQHP